jgi:TM2 domain-containing membrane protein YozV
METKKCTNCGADISEQATFCNFCGSAVAQQNQTQPQQPNYTTPNQNYAPPYQPYGQAPNQSQYNTQQQSYGQAPNQSQHMPPQQPYVQPPYQQKSKLAAGLLGIFLGGLGIHNFYLGHQKKALTQLLISIIGGIVTCGVAAIAMEIWGLVEGIQILTGSITVDANGIPLKD